MNAGPTPTPRPAPPTISANKMRTDPHRERRRGRAIHKCAPPAPPCTCPAASCTCPRPSRRHPNAMARPVIQQHQLRTTLAGPPLRPAPGVSRRSRIFTKKTVVYQADITGYRRIRVVSGSYQPNISSKTLYQGLADISLIYQADTMVVHSGVAAALHGTTSLSRAQGIHWCDCERRGWRRRRRRGGC